MRRVIVFAKHAVLFTILMFFLSSYVHASPSVKMEMNSKAEQTPLLTQAPLPTEIPVPTQEPLPTQIPAPTQKPKKGLVKEGKNYRYYKKGEAIKNTWKKINGHKYYFKANGNAAIASVKIKGKYYVFNAKGWLFTPSKNSFVKVNSKRYYITPKGNPIPGWHIIQGKLYYVYKNGRCAAGEKKDGITFVKDGYAKEDTESTLKIKVCSILSQITTPNMTQSQKLAICWEWCNDFYFSLWKFPDFTHKNWTREIALDMINTRSGNCYGLASTFAAFAKELGYSPLLVDTGTHCWNEINGISYDGMFPNNLYPSYAHPRRNIVKSKFEY